MHDRLALLHCIHFYVLLWMDWPDKSDSSGSARLEKGARLQVYWPDDQAWYFGKVECYNSKSGARSQPNTLQAFSFSLFSRRDEN